MSNQKIIITLSWVWTIILLFSFVIELNIPFLSAFVIGTLPASMSLNWLSYSNTAELLLVIVMTVCYLLSKRKLRTSNLLVLQIILLLQTFWLLPLLTNKIAIVLQTNNEELLIGLYYFNISLILAKTLLLIRLRLLLNLESLANTKGNQA